MDLLFIGGSGNISAACTRAALARGDRVTVLNRSQRAATIDGAEQLTADIHDEAGLAALLGTRRFDAVVDFIAFTPDDIARDRRLFASRCGHYVFISSASVYHKPSRSPWITEGSPRGNPHWQYSRDKIAAEDALFAACAEGFPGTVVRPSLTYDTVIPLPLASWTDWTIADRMLRGERIVVHGDGSSLWTITHADDFAAGLLGLLGLPQAIGEAFHITSDEVLSWDEIHRSVAAALGVEARIVHMTSDDIVACCPDEAGNLLGDKAVSALFDNTKIKRFVPGFQARIPFAHGIRRTLDWFRADPARMRGSRQGAEQIERLLAFHGARRAAAGAVS